jgi:hypothetical protein
VQVDHQDGIRSGALSQIRQDKVAGRGSASVECPAPAEEEHGSQTALK